MANYTPTFTKPYPSGWVDKPSKTTPATAAIMNSYDTAIATLEAYLRDNAIDTVSVSVEQFPSDGRQWIGTITVGSDQYRIYMPSLKYENSVSDGIKIGTITLGEQSFDVYAPSSSAGGSTVSVVPKTLTGTNIAEITVDGTTYQLYAPTSGGGSGSTVTAEATLTEGTQIGKITIDGTETILYAPTASQITVDSELSATSENAIQNKAVDAAVKKLQQQIDAGGAGGSVTVDSALSTESENPVQNKVVTDELNKKIETLDDESQAPDVVNFDLDSELSLTSVKGVQNKAIAEEFQKYTNGTKVVAKAIADEDGNNIKNTYVKKAEVQGATVELNHNVPRLVPKDITSYVTDGTLWKRLNGTDGFDLYEDIFCGDYIQMSRAITCPYFITGIGQLPAQTTGAQYVTIVEIDAMYGRLGYHHLVMIPGKGYSGVQHFGRANMLLTGGMKAYNNTTIHNNVIGSVVSQGSTADNATVNQQLYAEFGEHLKTIRETISSSFSETAHNRMGDEEKLGAASGFNNVDCQAVLMSELEVFGSIIFSSSGYDSGILHKQLALFTYSDQAIWDYIFVKNEYDGFWLRDVAYKNYYCESNGFKEANKYFGDYVRPRFVLA